VSAATQQVRFRVRRYHPETGRAPYWQEFTVAVQPGMTVLEGLHQIREEQDPTLVWRSSCRMGVCGSCGMVINGVPRLACNTQVLDVSRRELRIEALWNLAVVRDLVPDSGAMFAKHRSIRPYLLRDEAYADAGEVPEEYRQTPDQLTEYLQFSYCMKCGLCMAACPTLATFASYLGPMPLAAAQRYNADSRDQGSAQRRPVVEGDGGVFHCHYAGECSRVCPKGVDPARALQLLKRGLVFGSD
jgi:succinate dehydrogenase / fumarate reductase iron-sulfur subunit